ncbi:MAG: bifunctional oligoribonuclease/PAP phosphatase NrnA [Firmicutes bacterium]|nr:bifunctional oligoribonuclease/PAP phosphatase NrnA [Bacillota bacterium]
MNSLQEIAEFLQTCHSVLVTAHLSPDGDSIGSTIAMGLALERLGCKVTMFSIDGVPERFRFLSGSEKIVEHTLPETVYDCVLVLDCADHFRLLPIWEQIKDNRIINIDHHSTNELFGDLNYVDHKAAATGELAFALLEELKVPLDFTIAESLYVAISSDTGSFKFENTTTQTHIIASKLLAAGVNPGLITPKLFDLRSTAALMLLKKALCSLKISADGKMAWMVLTQADMQETAAKEEDLDGLINYAKNIEGVEVGILFREQKDGTIRIGFRSQNIDVSKIASKFGGGGHLRASGCSLSSSLEEATEIILTAVREEISG